ncbi:hypothetical protein Ancab_032028 [Ancistrocladus abbreviatus]
MADSAQQREVELEAMRREDSSWHPCQISLSSCGGLIVGFKGPELEEVILNKEEAFARLRVRSVPLKGDDCCRIQEGEHVLAALKSKSETLFFDAVVEKAYRCCKTKSLHMALQVRHSKRVYCRCNFMVKWFREDLGSGNLTIPSGSIMKLAIESINIHPVVAVFLNSGENPSCPGISFPIILDESDSEYELHGVLEKQIEEIGNSTDVPKQEILEEILMQAKQDFTEGEPQAKLAVRQVIKTRCEVSSGRNHFRRSTRSQSKIKREMQDQSNPCTYEESVGSRSALSPLAARAALASLVSNLPQKLDFSICKEGRNCTSLTSDATHEHFAVRLINESTSSMGFNSCRNNIKNGLISSVTSVFNSKPLDILEPLQLTRTGASGKVLPVEEPSGTVSSERRIGNDSSTVANSSGNIPELVKDKESMQPVRATRLTRSAVHAKIGGSDAEPRKRMLVEDAGPKASKGSTRVTRSVASKGEQDSTGKVKQALQVSNSSECTGEDASEENFCLPNNSVPRKKQAVSLVPDQAKLAEGNKKQKTSSSGEPIQKTTGFYNNSIIWFSVSYFSS